MCLYRNLLHKLHYLGIIEGSRGLPFSTALQPESGSRKGIWGTELGIYMALQLIHPPGWQSHQRINEYLYLRNFFRLKIIFLQDTNKAIQPPMHGPAAGVRLINSPVRESPFLAQFVSDHGRFPPF